MFLVKHYVSLILTQTSSQWAVGKYLWLGVREIWPDWEDEETEVWGETFSWQKSTNWHELYTIYVFNCRLKSSSTESSTLRNCESISTNTNVHIKPWERMSSLFCHASSTVWWINNLQFTTINNCYLCYCSKKVHGKGKVGGRWKWWMVQKVQGWSQQLFTVFIL